MSHREPNIQRYECPECADFSTREFDKILEHMHLAHTDWYFVSQLTYRGFVRRSAAANTSPTNTRLRSIYWLRPAGKCACGRHELGYQSDGDRNDAPVI